MRTGFLRRLLTAGVVTFVVASLSSYAVAAPTVPTIESPASGSVLGSAIVSVGGHASNDATLVRVSEGADILADTGVQGGAWNTGLSLSDGAHTLTARARDAGGAWSPDSEPVSFTVDTSIPSAPVIATPADGAVVAYSAVTIEGSAEPGARIRLAIDPGITAETAADSSGNWSLTRNFTDARYRARATAVDTAGNESLPGSSTFTVDTIPPSAPWISAPVNGSATNIPDVRITGRAEPGSQVTIYEAGAISTLTSGDGGTWGVTLTFTVGSHTIFARARDAAGHVSNPSPYVTFSVDRTPPAAPTIDSPGEDEVVSPSRAVITGRAERGATILISRAGSVIAVTGAGYDGTWSVRVEVADGPLEVTARARDAAGNSGPDSEPRRFIVDGTPPLITISTQDGALFTPLTPVRISGTATDANGVASVTLDFYDALGRGVASRRASCSGCPDAAQVSWLSTFAPTGRFVVRAYALDIVGNRSAPATITITNLSVSP